MEAKNNFDRRVAKAMFIARPKGSVKTEEKFLQENRKVVEYLREGRCSVREIATLCSVSPNTVMKAKRAISAQSAGSAAT